MNAASAELLSLHSAYNNCLKASMKDWVAATKSEVQTEWCR